MGHGSISTLLVWLLIIGREAWISSPGGRIFMRPEDYDRDEPAAALQDL
jgi:hypothetical protein